MSEWHEEYMETLDDRLSTSVSVSRRISDGNYGSGEVFVSVSGIKAGTTEEEIEEVLDTSEIAYKMIKKRLKQKIAESV